MPRTSLYKVGQKVIARSPVYNPLSRIEYPIGSQGEIIGVGIDAPFGFYMVEIEGDAWLVDVAPASKNAVLEIIE